MGNFAEFLFGFDDQFWHEFNLATDTSQIQDFEKFLQNCVHNEAPQVPIIYWVINHTISGSLFNLKLNNPMDVNKDWHSAWHT